MKTRTGIDWIRWTYKNNRISTNATPDHAAFRIKEPLKKALPWYDAALRLENGRVDWHTEKMEQGVMVTLTGRDLAGMREAGFSDRALLEFIHKTGGQTTRIDFAIDVIDGSVTPDEFGAVVDGGELQARSKKRLRWSSKDGNGEEAVTVQFGSRESERCLRVYDKAKEQKVSGDVIRFELETKGRQARALVRSMVAHGIQKTGKQAMRNFMSGNTSYWDKITDVGDNAPAIEKIGRKETDWERWVIDIALPAVIKAYKAGLSDVVEAVDLELLGIVPPPASENDQDG